jgi:hypothetical protein
MHIAGGRAPDGSAFLSDAAVQAMRTPSFDLHAYEGCRIGLGWIAWDWDGEPCIFHTGGTIFQLSWICVLPERPFAVCLLTNADTGGQLWSELGRWLFRTFADVEIPRFPAPPATPPAIDLELYAGSYRRTTQQLDVEARGDHLHVTIATESLFRGETTTELDLRPIDERRFHASVNDMDVVLTFLEPDAAGRPGYLHFASRAAVRVA